MRRALGIWEKAIGPNHSDNAMILNSLAELIKRKGNYEEAEPLYRRALELKEKNFGSNHPNTADTLTDLSIMFYEQGKKNHKSGRFEIAVTQLNEALELAKRAKNIDGIAACSKELKKSEKAMQQENKFGNKSNHSPTRTVSNLWKISGNSSLQIKQENSTINLKGESTMSMRITEVIVKWLEEQEWEERPEVDEEEQTSSTGFGHSISEDFSARCFLEAAEKAGFIKLYMYFDDSKIPASKLDEVIKYVNLVNVGIPIGLLSVLPEKKVLRFYAGIDVEEAVLEPQHISNLLSAGLRTFELRLPQFMAICFGGKTADEAMEIEAE
jgi:hypothetical protein